MRKIVSGFICAALLFSLAGCGAETAGPDPAALPGSGETAASGSASSDSAPQQDTAEEISYEVTCKHVAYYNYGEQDYGDYYALLAIKNTGNVNIEIVTIPYELKDGTGNLLVSGELGGTSPIALAPGETGYTFEVLMDGFESLKLDESVQDELIIEPKPEVEIDDKGIIRLDASNLELKETEYGSIHITGQLENNTSENAEWITVTGVFKDAEGTPIRIMHKIVEVLAAGGQTDFEIEPFNVEDGVTLDDIASYEVIAWARLS